MATRQRSRLPTGAYRIGSSPEGATRPPTLRAPEARLRRRSQSSRPATLRTRMVFVLICAALIPLAATTIGGVYIARASLLNQGQQVLRQRALASAATINNYLAGLQSSLMSSGQEVGKLYAEDPSLSQSTRGAIQNVLRTDSVANDFTASDATEFIGLNSVVSVSDQSGDIGEDLRGSSAVQDALKGSSYTLSPVTFDPNGPSDLQETLDATVPVRAGGASDGPVIGVLRARFSMNRFVALVRRDATSAGGGLLVERATGLLLAQSVLPNAKFPFATILPASNALTSSINPATRLATSGANRTVAFHPIAGLSVGQLNSYQSVSSFTAGTMDGSDTSSMLYVSAPIANSPAATQWVYLMATSRATLTAPADQLLSLGDAHSVSLAQVAVALGAFALLAAVIIAVMMARWAARWLTGSLRGLGETARAFLALSNDQRQTAEEQRLRLTTARGGLHELHLTAAELAESIERAISATEHAQRSSGYWAGQQPHASAAAPLPGLGHWGQWTAGVRDRLIRQHDICTGLAHAARFTGDAAVHMRERGQVINAQAIELEASLRASNSSVVRADTRQLVRTPNGSSRFTTRTLRVGLIGVLLLLGVVPSLLLATTTTTLVRANLLQQSDQALAGQAESRASALDGLLVQQSRAVAGLDPLYRALQDPRSGITSDLANGGLAGSVASAKKALGTTLLELADASTGTVLASSSSATLNRTVTSLAVYQAAINGRATTSLVYSAPGQQGWYYIAAPLRSADQSRLIGVAIGQFTLQPLQQIVSPGASAVDPSATSAMVVERSDGIILANSLAAGTAFAATGPLGPSELQQMWREGRYPAGAQPQQTPLPEVSSQVRAATPAGGPVKFTGASSNGTAQSSYWLVPLSNAPWALLEAQPVAAANGVADRLTRYDLLLAAIIMLIATMLAVILGQSITVPVQRLRARYREAARRLVAATRRQEEAARRQEAVLPPIESTAQLLTLETEEVASLLFPEPPAAQDPRLRAPLARPAPAYGWPADPNGVSDWQVTSTPRQLGNPVSPPLDALRRARVLANDWGLRQQRVLADLASALNATDQLSRASLEGQQDAAALTELAAELLASTR